MIPPIKIDISPMVEQLMLSQDEVVSLSRYILDNIGDRYMQLWEKRVDESLHSTRNTYKMGMRKEYEDDFTIAFILDGKGATKVALMIEQGASQFNMREGFKKSDKAKNKGQDNWYLTIPMRHATGSALGEAGIFANKMPSNIQSLVNKTGKPLKRGDLPQEHQQTKVNSVGYEHKAAIFEGLVKSDKKHHEGYFTFRRVSEASDIMSWIHPGFEESDLMGKSFFDLSSEVPQLIEIAKEQFLDKKFKE